MENIIYYTRTKSAMWLFSYNGLTQRYMGYSFRESLRKFKEYCNIRYKHNIILVKDNFCGTYGYMYN